MSESILILYIYLVICWVIGFPLMAKIAAEMKKEDISTEDKNRCESNCFLAAIFFPVAGFVILPVCIFVALEGYFFRKRNK